jgi:hypothetical protein
MQVAKADGVEIKSGPNRGNYRKQKERTRTFRDVTCSALSP